MQGIPLENPMTTAPFQSIITPQRSPISPRQVASLLLVSDILGLMVCSAAPLWIRLSQNLNLANPVSYLFGFIVLLCLYLGNTYRPYENIAGLWSPARVVVSNAVAGVIISALIYLFSTWNLTPLAWRSILFPGLILFTIWAVFSRQFSVSRLKAHARSSSWLVVGSGDLTEQFRKDFYNLNPYGKLTIFNGDQVLSSASGGSEVSSFISDESWTQILGNSYSGIIIHPDINLSDQQMAQLMQLRLKGSVVCQLPDFYEVWWQRVPPATLHDTWFAFGAGFDLVTGRFGLKIKRLIDILVASIMLVLLLPLMGIAALAVKVDSPGPIFYSQKRNGLHRNPFSVYKFRSMRQDAEKFGAQWAQKRDPRITRVGYFLRLTRIDELPQIWNVLVGEMSLIGPRPERPQFDEKLADAIPYYNLRYLVKPGITGWAQVMYPYGASIEDAYEKLSYDLYYIKNHSVLLDLAIFFKTIRVVFLGKGR
jgi:exopolysaccharide biosynthesis polyprenyl glycosylphosphotransferase